MLQNYANDDSLEKKGDDNNFLKTQEEKITSRSQIKIPIELIQIDDILETYPGEVVPADGIKINHHVSTVYESLLTGESIPVEKHKGDNIIGGCLCVEGLIILKVKEVGSNTTLGRIIDLVKYSSSEKKTNIQNVADSVAGIFVPCIMITSLLTFLVWLVITFNGYATIIIAGRNDRNVVHPALWEVLFALQFAIGVLAVACPCALGLAVPTAISVCTSVLAKEGILMKGGDSIESVCKIKAIVFDKTGTLTEGKFEYRRSAIFHSAMKYILESSNEFCEKVMKEFFTKLKEDGDAQHKTSSVLLKGGDKKKESLNNIKEENEIVAETDVEEERKFSKLTLDVTWLYEVDEETSFFSQKKLNPQEKKNELSNSRDLEIGGKTKSGAGALDKELKTKKLKKKHKRKKKHNNILKLDELSYVKLFWLILGSVESTSNHPIAISVKTYIKQHLADVCTFLLPVEKVKNTGNKIICEMLGLEVKVGSLDMEINCAKENEEMIHETFYSHFNMNNNFSTSKLNAVESVSLLPRNNQLYSSSLRRWVRAEQFDGCTVIGVEVNGIFIGAVSLRDSLKKESYEVLERLQNKYMMDVYMCTGDGRITANAFAKDLFIPEINVFSEALPTNKMNFIDSLKRKYNQNNSLVCMVGDGINDGPGIAMSDVGIALGSSQHIILNAADFIVINNNLTDILNIIEISKRTMQTIYMNVAWACCFNFICIPLAAGALWSFKIVLPPTLAGAMMASSSILVIMNSLSIKKFNGVVLNGQNKVEFFSSKKRISRIFNVVKLFVLRLLAKHRVSPLDVHLMSISDV